MSGEPGPDPGVPGAQPPESQVPATAQPALPPQAGWSVGSSCPCADLEPLLPLIADGALDAEREPAAFAHLAGCPACQEALLRHDLVTLALERAPRRPARAPLRLLPWAAAAALLLAVLGGLAVLLPPPPGPAPALAAAPPAPAPADEGEGGATEISEVRAPDGRTIWIIRRKGETVILDPAARHRGGERAQAVRY